MVLDFGFRTVPYPSVSQAEHASERIFLPGPHIWPTTLPQQLLAAVAYIPHETIFLAIALRSKEEILVTAVCCTDSADVWSKERGRGEGVTRFLARGGVLYLNMQRYASQRGCSRG